MSDEVVRPQDLEPLKEPLVEAVIFAFMMNDKGLLGNLVGKPDESHIKNGSGTFKYTCPEALDWDYGFTVTYPDGDWTFNVPIFPDESSSSDSSFTNNGTTYETFDAVGVWADLRERVSTWIDPWIQSPNPNEFKNQIASIADIIKQLYVQDEVQVGGQAVGAPGDDVATTTDSPLSDVRTAISDMKSFLGDLAGGAIDALETAYANDVALTISGQRALATVAGLTIAGEAMAWNNTYKNLKTLIQAATTDFESYAKSQSASGQDVVAGLTVVSGAATIGAGATAAFPPFTGALAAVSGVAALGAALWPTQEARVPTEIMLGGGSPEEYWEAFERAIKDTDLELTYAENDLVAMCTNALNDLASNPDAYSITRKRADGTAQPHDNLNGFLTARIDISPSKMRGVAGCVASIGDHQRGVAGLFGGSDASGDPAAFVKSEWNRGTLPSGVTIGRGSEGPYDHFKQVIDTLIDLLIEEYGTAHRIADHCVAIANDFAATDDGVVDNLAKSYDTVPLPTEIGISGN